MPTLDLSFLTADSLIAGDPFNVNRRAESIDDNGRTVIATTVISAVGAVYPTPPNDLVRTTDAGYANKSITVVTSFDLRMTSTGFQPDQVEWPVGSGDLYVVRMLNDYSRYGTGFVEAQCEAVGAQQMAPV